MTRLRELVAVCLLLAVVGSVGFIPFASSPVVAVATETVKQADLLEQRQRPLAVKHLVRTRLDGGRDLKLRVRRFPIQRERGLAAAALEPLRFFPFVRQKIFQRRQQERAEAPAFRAQAFEIILGEEAREERLHRILRVRFRVAAPPDVGVE